MDESKRKQEADRGDAEHPLSPLTTTQLKQLVQQLSSSSLPTTVTVEQWQQYFHTLIDSLVQHQASFQTFPPTLTQHNNTFSQLIHLLLSSTSSTATAVSALSSVASSSVSWSPVLQQCITARYGELTAAALLRTVSITPACLVDYDWSVRMIMSSEALAVVKTPVCLLSLTLRNTEQQQQAPDSTNNNSNSNQTQTVSVELTRAQLDRLLDKFAEIQKAIQPLQT